MNESAGRYALGVLCLLIVGGSLALAAVALRRRYLPGWSGARARLAEAATGLIALVWILELLGAAHLFRLVPIVLACALTGAAAAWFLWPASSPARGSRRLQLAAVVAVPVAAALVAEWAVPTIDYFNHGIKTFDSLWYHLPWAASFAQSHQVTALRFTDVEYLDAFYPASAEMLHGLGIVLLGRDTISPAANLVWLPLALLAAWCVGARWRLGLGSMLGAALAFATPMMVFSQAGSAANDIVAIFFVLAAAGLLLASDWERPAVALAGACAGLAIGVKLSVVVAAVALTVGAVAAAPAGRRRALAASWLPGFGLAGGFWYLRNLIAVGNPVPWVGVPGLTRPVAPLQAHTGFSVAHYATDTHIWSHVFGPALRAGLGDAWPLILALAVVGPVLCLLRGSEARVRMLALVALATLVGYLVTPESAAGPAGNPLGFAFNLRYGAPALALCLMVLPLAPVLRGRRMRAAVAAVLVALIGITVAQSRLWPAQRLGGAWIVAGGVAAGWLLLRLAARRRRAALVAFSVAALAAGAFAGYLLQGHYLRGRYVFTAAVSPLAPVWGYFRHARHARVAVAGTFAGFFSYPLYGLDDSNRVTYVAHRGPHGSFTPIGSCAAWRRAVDAGRFGYLVATPARDPWHPHRLGPSPEGGWTLGDPAAQVVLRRVAYGQPIYVFRLRGPLDPAGCPVRPVGA